MMCERYFVCFPFLVDIILYVLGDGYFEDQQGGFLGRFKLLVHGKAYARPMHKNLHATNIRNPKTIDLNSMQAREQSGASVCSVLPLTYIRSPAVFHSRQPV